MTADNETRRRFLDNPGKLLALAAGVLLFAVVCTLFVTMMRPIVQRWQARRAIEKAGGSTWCEYQTRSGVRPPGPEWLRNVLGDRLADNVLADVVQVNVESDATAIRAIRTFPMLTALYLTGPNVTDAAMGYLRRSPDIQWFGLTDTEVTSKRTRPPQRFTAT